MGGGGFSRKAAEDTDQQILDDETVLLNAKQSFRDQAATILSRGVNNGYHCRPLSEVPWRERRANDAVVDE